MTIFAYGHTGAGKTFTTFGDQRRGVKGVIHLATDFIFSRLQNDSGWNLGCQFVEIYNEKLKDLLCLTNEVKL